MKLHVTLTSPYARITRVAVMEHGLENEVEIIEARTREPGSPYYDIAPSGRVPFLELEDGRGFEESDLICQFFDSIGSGPPISRPASDADWDYGRLHALARSYIDGVGVWGRELRRPVSEQSPTIICHERDRNQRLAAVWEREIHHPVMNAPLNRAQLTLYCAMDALTYYTGVEPTPDHPNLIAWRAKLSARPSLTMTRPPKRSTTAPAATPTRIAT